jgi:hypothetical protein
LIFDFAFNTERPLMLPVRVDMVTTLHHAPFVGLPFTLPRPLHAWHRLSCCLGDFGDVHPAFSEVDD